MRFTKRQRRVLWLVLFTLAIVAAETATACPTCKEALNDSSRGGDIIGGYFWSILFMMSTPFIIFASLCAYFYFQVRKARGLGAAAQDRSSTAGGKNSQRPQLA